MGMTANLRRQQMTGDNLIYLVIGALAVAVSALGYQLYETKKEPGRLAHQSRRKGYLNRGQINHVTLEKRHDWPNRNIVKRGVSFLCANHRDLAAARCGPQNV
jgi:hypothetical protein